MTADIGAVGDRGLRSGDTRTGFSVRGIGKNRCRPKLLAAVTLALVLIVAAVACFGVAPGMSKTARSFSTPWTIYTIDSNGGRWPSVAIDSNDYLHASYSGNGSLMYATNAGGSWVISGIDNISGGPSLALDSEDNIHISAVGASGLQYVTNAGGSWANYLIDSNISWPCGSRPSLALDSQDKAHISYQGYQGNNDLDDLRYATNANGSWEICALSVFDKYTDPSPSLAVDYSDKVHISYHNNVHGYGGLYYATNSNGYWKLHNIRLSYTDPFYWSSSIATDSNDKVHICSNEYVLSYTTNANGSWESSTVDTPISPGSDGFIGISLTLDSSDNAHISYTDHRLWTTKYATNANGFWEIYTIDDGSPYGSSLALDSAGNVHIVYRTLSGIMYATNAEPIIPEFGAAGVVLVVIVAIPIVLALRKGKGAPTLVEEKKVKPPTPPDN